jgi:lipopolysaccharide transport system ATP-binding protein
VDDAIIRAEGLGKRYRLGGPRASYATLRESLTGAVAGACRRARGLLTGAAPGRGAEDFWALRDVSFEVRRGEVLGIIGRNGAGKSTLLKILSRITEPTEGRAVLGGRVGSLLEVGTGFHPELNGRENIYLSGAILGMSKAEIDSRFEAIVGFAGVEKFLETPVKHYSSGMYVRLGFAVAAHLEPEILLVDEVLAVGDAEFQKKCLGKMGEVARGGRTVLFVSHNLAAVRQICRSGLWLDAGRIVRQGPVQDVVEAYLAATLRSQPAAARFVADPAKPFQVLACQTLGGSGEPRSDFSCDEDVVIELFCAARQSVPGLAGYLALARQTDGAEVLVSDSGDLGGDPLDGLAPGSYRVLVNVPRRTLAAGAYVVYLNFTSGQAAGGFNVDSPAYVCCFRLADHASQRGNRRGGFLSTLLPWQVQPAAGPPLPPSSPEGGGKGHS